MNQNRSAVPRLPQQIQAPATQNIITLDTVWKKYRIYKNHQKEDAEEKKLQVHSHIGRDIGNLNVGSRKISEFLEIHSEHLYGILFRQEIDIFHVFLDRNQ